MSLHEADLDLGTLRLLGTGTISGELRSLHDPEKPWRFARGGVHLEGFGEEGWGAYLTFKSDAEGQFRVDGVPCGRVTVSFAYHATADIIGTVNAKVRVREGKESVVRFEEREREKEPASEDSPLFPP